MKINEFTHKLRHESQLLVHELTRSALMQESGAVNIKSLNLLIVLMLINTGEGGGGNNSSLQKCDNVR